MRVEPVLADRINHAAGPLSRSRWLEIAAREKLQRDALGMGQPLPEVEQPSDEPPLQRIDHEFPRRPAPRLGGGRIKR